MPRTLQITRHFHVAQKLREMLRTLPPGTEVPTIKNLINDFGASQTTIDRAMAQLRREGLVTRPAGKQRLVVNAMSDPAARRIALIRPDYPSRTFDEVARSIVQQGRKSDTRFDLIYYRSIQELDISLATGDADGAVLIPTSEPFPPHLRAALERPRKPLVITQEFPPGINVHGVHLDNHQMGKMAVEYLISLGHQKILYFDNEPPTYSCSARRDAWRDAMTSAGLDAGDELVCDCGTQAFEDSLHAAYKGFNKWMDAPTSDFTAVFVATSTLAGMAVMRVLYERGIKVPDDVSVISYCGEESLGAYTNPTMTTLQPNMADYGAGVSDLLDELFLNPAARRRQIELPPALVVRGSTAPARIASLHP